MEKILNYWYEDMKDDFKNKKEFENYLEVLQDLETQNYFENISKYKKRLKKSREDNVEDILSKKVLNYFIQLQKYNIQSIIVDEAHHLTSWWSKVIYYLWENINKDREINPFII